MNNTFSLEQISKTGNLNADLILRQYKLDIMARFMQRKSECPRLTQEQISKELGYSSSTVKRYRNDINMRSPYRNNGPKRSRLTPIDSRYATEQEPETNSKPQNNNTKSKRKSKNIQGGSLIEHQSEIVVDEEYLDNLINK